MGLRRVYRAEAECRLRVDGSRTRSAPWGLAGGRPGGMGRFGFSEGVVPFDHGSGVLQRGQIVEIITPGAGGYGPAAKRGVAQVQRDLAERRIGADAARAAGYHLA